MVDNRRIIDRIITKEVQLQGQGMTKAEQDILADAIREEIILCKNMNGKCSNFRKLYTQYLQSKEWKELRKSVLARDNNQCLLCSMKANHVHHVSYGHFVKHGYSLRIECGSLCKKCHRKIHRK